MKLYSAANPTEAHIVCELLKSEQIAAEVRGEGLFGLKGELPMTMDSDPYVWLVATERLERATAIVSDYQSQKTDDKASWLCSNCGEENEPQFGACWNCGSPATVSGSCAE